MSDSHTDEAKPNLRYVDTRETAHLRTEMLKRGFEQKALGCGDFFFFTSNYKKVGIERKEVGDLINSLGERLASQLYRMVEFYDVKILLIEGSLQRAVVPGQSDKIATDRGIENWGWSALWNCLQSWQDQGVTLQFTTNTEHTIQRVMELYAYYQVVSHTGGVKRVMTADDRVLSFPKGVGEKTGEGILKHFGTLKGVACASVQDLLACEGVGPKRANDIYAHFNRSSADELRTDADRAE